MRQSHTHTLAIGASIALAAAARADLLWNEPSQGDLSNNRLQPTAFNLNLGSNELIGFLAGGASGPIDLDYFSVTIPAGMQLAHMNLLDYLSVDQVAFIAIQPGPIFPDDPENVSPGDLMGWLHVGSENVGTDILTSMGTHGIGFTPPLPSGTYSFWMQQTDDPTDYLMDFVVVPAPGSFALLALAPTVLARSRRRAHS